MISFKKLLLKSLFLSIFIYCSSICCLGQALQGEWEGTFETNPSRFPNQRDVSPIYLYFVLNEDSLYSIWSYSQGPHLEGQDSIVICSMSYKLSGIDSIYLAEEKVISPENITAVCLQKMKLRIIEKTSRIILKGSWISNECQEYGTISFRKKKKKTEVW